MDAPEGERRSKRARGGLILNESLLFALHEEMMTREPKGPSRAQGRPPRGAPPAKAAGHTPAGPTPSTSGAGGAKRARGSSVPSSSVAAAAVSRDLEEQAANAHTAWATGLAFDGLAEDEEGLLPLGAIEEDYARVRNAVLGMWRADVSKPLTLERALAGVRPKDQGYALAAWRFLNALGYINYGVSPAAQAAVAASEPPSGPRGSVIVVGSGCAGLAAARQLRTQGYRVVIVEGKPRPGGRVWSERLTGPGGIAPVVADLGGSIITGIDGNPLAVVTKQLKIPLAHIRDAAPLYGPDGAAADSRLDTAVEQHYNEVLMRGSNEMRKKWKGADKMSLQSALERLWIERYGELERRLKRDGSSGASGLDEQATTTVRHLFEWHLANLEFANASRLDSLSLRHWDQDDPYEVPGPHCFVPGCNGRWLRSLTEGLAIMYDSPVSEIRYCATGVAVTAGARELRADAVVVTAPLGVLKRGGIAFNPPLSERKRGAIARLGFGDLNKVILAFPKVFWSRKEDMFGHISKDPATRGEAFLFYSYADISGGAQLTALVAGAAAEEQERRGDGECVARVMDVLRDIFEPQGVSVPAPLSAIVTRWGSDPMTYGAYSSLPLGSRGGADYDALAESVGGRVFFAGEATTRKYPATMHGAFFTGLWAAAAVDTELSAAAGRPQAGAVEAAAVVAEVVEKKTAAARAAGAAKPAAGAVHVAVTAAPLPADSESTETSSGESTDSDAVHSDEGEETDEEEALPVRHRRKRPPTRIPTALVPPAPAAPQNTAELDAIADAKLQLSSRLKELFETPSNPPDLEVGAFKVFFAAPGSNGEGYALVRMDVASAKGLRAVNNGPPLCLYVCVPADAALALMEQPDNHARVALLGSLPGVSLTGRQGLGPQGLAVLDSVLAARAAGVPRPSPFTVPGMEAAAAAAARHAVTAAAVAAGAGRPQITIPRAPVVLLPPPPPPPPPPPMPVPQPQVSLDLLVSIAAAGATPVPPPVGGLSLPPGMLPPPRK